MKSINIRQGMSAAGGALIAMGALCFTTPASADEGDVIINEWNAVGPNKFLEDDGSDTHFDLIQGNGGDWMELVVLKNGADLRNYKIHWKNDDGSGKEGYLNFTSNNLWRGSATPSFPGLKAGTIIIIRKGVTDSFPEASTLSCSGDANGSWDKIIEVDSNGTYVTEDVMYDAFQVDNDGWRARILDASSATVQTWVGEPPFDSMDTGNNCTACTGSGVSSTEVGKLEENPSAAAATNPTAANYNDGDSSTYGDPNQWDSFSVEQCFKASTGCGTCTP